MAWFDEFNLPGATIDGYFGFIRADGPDDDDYPDVALAHGWVTFKATTPAARVDGAWLGIEEVRAQIFEGQIVMSEQDSRPVRLLATDAPIGVADWAWTAKFDLDGFTLAPLTFRAPRDTTVNLTADLIPIKSQPYQIVEGASIVDAEVSGDGAMRFELSDGTFTSWMDVPNGERGVAGPPGEKGDRGDDGAAATLAMGSVTAGTVADAWMTGTPLARELHLTLPRGPKGDRGDEGQVTAPQVKALLTDETNVAGEWTNVALRRSWDIREFGAVGDGVADDTQAVEAGLNALSEGGTLTISVPVRTTREVAVSLPGTKAKRVEFTQSGQIVGDFTTNGAAILSLSDSDNIHLDNPALVGTGPGESEAQTGIYGLVIKSSTRVAIRGGSITKTHREGISLTDVAGAVISGVFLADLNAAFRMGAIQLVRCQDVTVTGCEVTRSGWKGISASICDRIAVTDCNVHDIVGGDGILLGGCVDFRIVSNTVAEVGADPASKAGDGIKITEAKAGDGKASTHGVIASNTVRGIRKDGGGIRVTASKHIVVTGNSITDTENNGIPVASSVSLAVPIHCEDVTIVGNALRNIGTHAIYVGPDSARLAITGNTIDKVTTGSGVLLAGGANVVVTGNAVTRTQSIAVRVFGDNVTGVVRENTTPGSFTQNSAGVVGGRAIETISEVDAPLTLTNSMLGSALMVRQSGTITVPEGATLDAGWNVIVKNVSNGAVTLARSGVNTVDGAASVALQPYQGAHLMRRNASTFVTV